MNIKVIINSIILIFILHIIILNINYSVNVGNKNKIENFEDVKKENSMAFLTDNTSNEEFKKKLLNYMQYDQQPKLQTEFENKNVLNIKPSNSYLSNNNEPNFESNVADISKFYKVNYDNLDENNLKTASDELMATPINKLKNDIIKENIVNTGVGKECNENPYLRKSNNEPDTWNYKNEIPMNGGTMNGITGFDSLESQFSLYNPNKLNLQNIDDTKFNNIPHDDLRKPIVYEN